MLDLGQAIIKVISGNRRLAGGLRKTKIKCYQASADERERNYQGLVKSASKISIESDFKLRNCDNLSRIEIYYEGRIKMKKNIKIGNPVKMQCGICGADKRSVWEIKGGCVGGEHLYVNCIKCKMFTIFYFPIKKKDGTIDDELKCDCLAGCNVRKKKSCIRFRPLYNSIYYKDVIEYTGEIK